MSTPEDQGRRTLSLQRPGGSVTLTIPLTVTVSLGRDAAVPAVRGLYRRPVADADSDEDDFVAETEAVASDYSDRPGYEAGFLGEDAVVELPKVSRDADDVLSFELDGISETQLRYEHFSVVMSRNRRMCFLSACNIDGDQSRKSARVRWKWDPRIPKMQQIMKECYGSPPKFSRGHMTRREDPGWGTRETAKRGNEDSMHVTNVTPQMQAFNAPIWLALEDYALQHAREDQMRISVFTGPYFADDDPEMYGVRIPLAFWKVIAFIHDETGKLCATGYEMNQEQTIQAEQEFVFGGFTSPQLGTATQVSIRSIQARSGIDFGNLAALDPLAGEEETISDVEPRPPLLALEQIRFVR
jgi:endonuclease G, mitochondrial